MKKKGLLIVISGPSGAGKGTICKEWLKRHPEAVLSVSATTRPPRPMEIEGVNYFFKSREEFKKMIENNDFLEYAKVYDNYYGTPRKYVQQKLLEGRDVILEIDIQGALKVKDRFDEGVFILLYLNGELKAYCCGTTRHYSAAPSAFEEINFIKRYDM